MPKPECLRLVTVFSTTCGLLLAAVLLATPPVSAQLSRIDGATAKIYTLIPTLPLQDDYTARSGDGTGFKTLLHRFMLYHMQIKGRSPFSRLDWKLTFADYLDINETMTAAVYPGNAQLDRNPYTGDRQIIQALNREERNALLAALLTSFGASAVPDMPLTQPRNPIVFPPSAPAAPVKPAGTVNLTPGGNANLLK